MTLLSLRLVAALARGWTRVYTCGLESSVRDRRRAEIDSDLWAQLHEGSRWSSPERVLDRLVRGLHDDVRWRIACAVGRDHRSARRVVFALASAAVLASFWAILTAWPAGPPHAPTAPELRPRRARVLPPPPAPPPPPCNPPGIGRPSFSPCTPLH